MVNAVRELSFRDKRTPHEVRVHFESRLRRLFEVRPEHPLTFGVTVRMTGFPYALSLRLVAALPLTNAYDFRAEAQCGEVASGHRSRCRESLEAWFGFWTRGLCEAPPPGAGEGSPERYAALSRQALSAESHLSTIEAIQREIVAAMRDGATFSTAHKEGGTILSYRDGRFRSSTYGDYEDQTWFSGPAEFLVHLRRFLDWEAVGHAKPDVVPEIDAWKVILRLLSPPQR